MAKGFVCLVAIVDRLSRKVLSHRVSITMEADFCVEALEEALARFGKTSILNTVLRLIPKIRRSTETPHAVNQNSATNLLIKLRSLHPPPLHKSEGLAGVAPF